MPGVVTDILETQLDLTRLGNYVGGMGTATDAVRDFTSGLDAAQKSQLAFASATAGVGILGSMAAAGVAAADEQATLARAVGNFKGAFPLEEMEDFTGEISKLTGIDDGKIAGVVGILGTFGTGAGNAKSLTLPILNASEALKDLGVSSEQVSNSVGKAIQTGDAGALRRSGIIIDAVAFKSASAAGRVDMLTKALQAQGGDAAIAFRQTLPGALQASQTAVGNLVEAFGGPLVGTLGMVAGGVESLATWAAAAPEPLMQTAAVLGGVLGVGLIGLGGALAFSVLQAGLLAGANAKLMNSALKTSPSIRQETNDLKALGAGAQQAAVKMSMLDKAKGFMSGPGGGMVAMAGAGMLLGMASDAIPDGARGKGAVDWGSTLMQGAGMGGSLGALFGPTGLIVGGISGAVVAGVARALSDQKTEEKADVSPELAELRKQNATLQAALDELRGIRSGQAVSHRDLAGATQMRAMGRAVR